MSKMTLEKISWLKQLVVILLLTTYYSLPTVYAQTTVPSAASVAPAAKPAPVAPAYNTVASPNQSVVETNGWKLVRTIKLAKPGAASLDRRGNFYVADEQDNIHQYGPDGQALNTYSPPQPGHTAQIEAWNSAKILVFYDDRQEILLLDRFMTPITSVQLLDFVDGSIRVATLAPDDRLWLFNESDLTLRQFDPTLQRLMLSTPLDLIIGRSKPDFRFLRQYQNNLYLVDRTSGIFVFDNLGNYRKKLPFTGLNSVGFRGDELYYLTNSQVQFFQLYNFTERTMPLPTTTSAAQQVLLGEQYAYLVTPAGVLVYQMTGG
ncbi:hypothetical protein [Hymenobacter sp. GOD-10R]|uniref:hypothetical protein n=1 Tax=Hymenobacter sp. GOD-10R TaxID=3093922 RepID=UPI002D77EA5B|nr:hypothetical protein [Hymenobacter sp. GOD-10R]WRQ29603.1 hypothetical protein SD425_04925 [Hymenobacter sp. GOD-10R]